MANVVLNGGVSSNNNVNQFNHQCTWKMYITYINPITLIAETVKIGYPLTVEFNIVKNTDAQTNTANFRIYNLNPTTRSNLFQERSNVGIKKMLTFYAGYDQEIEVFKGYIQEAYSQSSGNDIITNIEAWDIGLTNNYISVSFKADTTFKDAYKYVASQIKDLELAEIGELEGTFKMPVTFAGHPLEILNKITNFHTFIDNGKLKTLQNNECIDVPVYVATGESGLLGTPQRRGGQIVINTLFQPNLSIGQLYEIKSRTASEFDGTFKVNGYTHSGMISGAVAGSRTTEINLLVGALMPNSNYVYTGTVEGGFKKVKLEQVSPVNATYGSSIEEIYRYIKDKKGAIPSGKITQNILWKEMLLNDNKAEDIEKEITREILYNCQQMAKDLQSYLNTYYPSKKVNIVSGWRTSVNNKKVGGATGKHGHMYGNAIDFNIIGVSSQSAYGSVFRPYWNKSIGYCYINTGNNIHIQRGWAGK